MRNIGTFLATLGLAALPMPAQPQDRLPTVPGVLLVDSRDAAACIAREDGEDGKAPLDGILDTLARSYSDLRTISFTWSDIREAARLDVADPLKTDAARLARLDAWAGTEPGVTAHAYPDGLVFSELTTCQPEAVTVAPDLAFPAARAWLLPVEGAGDGPSLGLPDQLDAYLADLRVQADGGEHPAMCVLLGGVLNRQPAFAVAIAAPVVSDLNERLGALGLEGRVNVATTGVLLNPNGFRLGGWDVLLLADVLDQPAEGPVCPVLVGRIFGDDALTLDPDPREVSSGCPEAGGSLRISVAFEPDLALLGDGQRDAIDDALDCFDGFEDVDLHVTVEGYASRDGAAGNNRALSNRRAAVVRDAIDARLRRPGAPAPQIRATGFGGTTRFGEAPGDNQIAVVTISTAPEVIAMSLPALASPVVTAYLDRDERTCRPAGHRPVQRAEMLLGFLTSDYGRDMMEQMNLPEMLVVLHNQVEGPDGNSAAFARELQQALGRFGACGNSGGPHVGYIYERSGPPYFSGDEIDGPERRDFFILPPKITWIYPVSDRASGPDLAAFAEVVRKYRMSSDNLVDLERLADPTQVQYRRQWLNMVDVLRYEAPVPVSDVLNALREARAGTGWVNLTSGWD